MKRSLGILIIALFVFVGCVTVKEGRVIDLQHEDEREYETLESFCTAYDKDGFCSMRVYYNQHHVDDEDWYVTIRGRNKDGTKEIENTYRITKEVWKELNVGDWFAVPKDATLLR